MGQLDNIDLLKKKMYILTEIISNTETQGRFVKQRKMKGLARVLSERAELIKELAAVNKELVNDQSWKEEVDLTEMVTEINSLEQELLKYSRQVIEEAMSERRCIAAELRNSRMGRQAQTKYINPWALVARGRRINQKG